MRVTFGGEVLRLLVNLYQRSFTQAYFEMMGKLMAMSVVWGMTFDLKSFKFF